MSDTPVAEVLADLKARLRSHDRDGMAHVLLDKTAHERALALRAAATADRDNRSGTTLRVLGEWFLRRYAVLPAGSGQADLRMARLCAGLLHDLGDRSLTERLAELHGEEHLALRTNETVLALLDKFDTTGDERQVIAARTLIGTLEEILTPDHPLRGELSVATGQLAATLFSINGDPAHRDEAVRAMRHAMTGSAPDTPHTADKIVALAGALLARYDDQASGADLDEAQALLERLVTSRPDAPPANAAALLAVILSARFERTRRITDLDRAVVISRDALDTTPSGHPIQVTLRQNLLACLLRRAEHLGQDADIAEAVRMARTILSALGPAGPIRCHTLNSLAVLLMWRYARGLDPADLTEAVRISEEAVRLSGTLHSARSWTLMNRATILWARFMIEGRQQDLDEALDACREAMAANARNTLHDGVIRTMLTRLLTAQGSLDEALETGRASIAQFGPGHPLRAAALTDLADVYRQRYALTGDRADLDAAVGLWRSAVHSPSGKPGVRMQAADHWLRVLLRERDFLAAAEPAKARVELLPVLAWRGLDRTGRERRLARLGDVASIAAALALELGRPEQAVELLEQGRSVLWAQAIQTRSDLSALRAAAPRLAAELDRTRTDLDRAAAHTEGPAQGPKGTTDRTAMHYRTLVERWEALLADARAVPGFADFLSAVPFETLRSGLAESRTDGVVVIVNVAKPRCDALIVRPTGLQPVALPWLTFTSAQRRAAGLLAAITEAETGAGGPGATNLRQTLGSMVRWLWDAVAAPVIEALDAAEPDRDTPHRVWWCPTGPLTLLPLHAAGRYGRAGRRRRPTVPDRTVSSYTTGVGALLRARRPVGVSGPATTLAVGMPHTEGMADLPAVARELDHITDTVPQVRSLVGPAATPEAVLAGLGRHRRAHFACHATQNVAEPGRGALHLSGGDLSVHRLATLDLTDAELAYLSACHTAGGSMDLADEAINLAAALQLAGYRNVIGTLWSVADQHAAAVANTVYRTVTSTEGPTDYAAALTSATAELRARHPDRPDIWAPFIHLGGQ